MSTVPDGVLAEGVHTIEWMPRRPADGDVDAISAAIGARIARARKERGMSQVALAERIGASQNLLSAYELGKARIGADVLLKIARALKVSADDLLGLRGRPPDDFELPARRLMRRLAQFHRLPRRRQDGLLSTIDAALAGCGIK